MNAFAPIIAWLRYEWQWQVSYYRDGVIPLPQAIPRSTGRTDRQDLRGNGWMRAGYGARGRSFRSVLLQASPPKLVAMVYLGPALGTPMFKVTALAIGLCLLPQAKANNQPTYIPPEAFQTVGHPPLRDNTTVIFPLSETGPLYHPRHLHIRYPGPGAYPLNPENFELFRARTSRGKKEAP
jgi:hypothetical protein